MRDSDDDLAVVGAGPYGLSVAAHAAARGLTVRVFGRVMDSWNRMPPGMLLKSEPWASDLSDPAGLYGLAAYAAIRGVRAEHGVPLPVAFFASYGEWFARQALPEPVDQRMVTAVGARPDGRFAVTTEDGEVFGARTVALAIGVMPFMEVPAELRHLPSPELVTHSSHHSDFGRFAGRDVTVVGAGQAALETAVLLTEAGARARLVARAGRLEWNTVPPSLHRTRWEAARAPHTGLGCGWRNLLYARTPGLFRRLPDATRERLFGTALGPAGAWWLRHRFESVADVRPGRRIVAAEAVGDSRVRLTLAAGTGTGDGAGAGRPGAGGGEPCTVETDHVVAATGFTPRLDRVDLLSEELRDELRTLDGLGAPEAGPYFESSHPGLFLAGLLTAPSYGPAMRFVYGSGYTAVRLVRGVERRLREPRLPEVPAARPRPAEDGAGARAAEGARQRG
ncbi:NAD(P)-binding domain-containing protein [Streptomyces sp. MUM 203J]|uniref:NAD(P)-binding domain-containing protein n=1 Tax=Streptomyces sp. MUM 203J TaxID=2791990 RepID=UPI001F040A9B|nr:NAD(P)-binding domain-containing protein [Streptomyces sp. MUM 203J]MCH0543408.1 NAD(P)-binding domain-containing protein [Streptomyces sp. MUM 203J]